MCEKLQLQNILPLMEELKSDSEIYHWEQHDFTDSINNPNQPIYTYKDLAFIAFSQVLDEAEILMIWCSPKARGQKIATKLLQESLDFLKQDGVKTCFLEVAKNNIAALKLYERIGFCEFGIRKNYYKLSDGVLMDAILMRYSLPH